MIQQTYEDGLKHVHVLSYGGGTQSTALLLMALRGEIAGIKPDYIIFSDTGWEEKKTYAWVQKVNEYIKAEFGQEVIITNNGNLRSDLIRAKEEGVRVASIPFFTKSPQGKNGMVWRQCTQEYKIAPVKKKTRELLGYKPRQKVREMVHIWKGISTDEIQRVKPIADRWITAEHPLVDIVEMSRDDCIAYVEALGLGTPPASSCIGCPFHSNEKWFDMKKHDKESWDDAVFIDETIRSLPKFNNQLFLHVSRKPLAEVEFHEQTELDEFINECEGFCGL
jgi:hypothetical protein